ncbi:probable pantoate--beta-alanine ligase [Ustilago bromivora]|uniref:Pantoate--beta-alanine ligase n=1 Tax=Ustilago bromivora TaxID=307758 RepID=A0A1K0FVL8_9BASI|nr:probable pantoate--beta-alanine ligase [Ustilago bromivora]SYW75434.1 probable pantoate--beta-alanine ligase [Ustilago bromivora]
MQRSGVARATRSLLDQASSSSSAGERCARRALISTANTSVRPSTRSNIFGPQSRTTTQNRSILMSQRRNLPPSSNAASSSKTTVASSADSPVPDSPIPVFTTVQDYRAWRHQATKHGKSVGFVATMGALHQGHLKLVEASLEENDYTVISIFVNPAQFAPTEDLASYPRTLDSDIQKLATVTNTISLGTQRKVDIVFAPSVREMYPNGLTQVVSDQIGAFVEVKGLSHQMEGGSRPTFFRGVATVVTKLFHIIQPDRTYFGQKDIQQTVVLRRLVSDLVFSHPPSAEHLRVIATGRDPNDNLALSSRNAYLTPDSRQVAPVLYRALKTGQDVWGQPQWTDSNKEECIRKTLESAKAVVWEQAEKCKHDGKDVNLKLDYISLNHPKTLENLEQTLKEKGPEAVDMGEGAVLSGAALISQGKDGKLTRLIDNLLLGFKL